MSKQKGKTPEAEEVLKKEITIFDFDEANKDHYKIHQIDCFGSSS